MSVFPYAKPQSIKINNKRRKRFQQQKEREILPSHCEFLRKVKPWIFHDCEVEKVEEDEEEEEEEEEKWA